MYGALDLEFEGERTPGSAISLLSSVGFDHFVILIHWIEIRVCAVASLPRR